MTGCVARASWFELLLSLLWWCPFASEAAVVMGLVLVWVFATFAMSSSLFDLRSCVLVLFLQICLLR